MIETITLTDFRNHKMCRLHTHGRHNVIITGPNGAGKTAILEAVSMLSGDRGMRAAPMTDIARFNGNGGFSVFAALNDDTEISVFFNAGDTNRRARIDGDAATLSDLSSLVRMVWLTPREDRLFVDSAAERRAFFDRLVTSFDSSHAPRVGRLAKLLSERAFALKNGRDTRWIDALDTQIAGASVAIAAVSMVTRSGGYAAQGNATMSGTATTSTMAMRYVTLQGFGRPKSGRHLKKCCKNAVIRILSTPMSGGMSWSNPSQFIGVITLSSP